ncbi:MAG: class I SAM-dependent methyltransferase [Promethearchaeota archaeon]
MFWDNKYLKDKHVWGENPSELGSITVQYLKKNNISTKKLEILDIGCGYGRDLFYISEHIDCMILGVDSSKEAIKLAKNHYKKENLKEIEFLNCNFKDLEGRKFDVIFSSNFYQILKKKERDAFTKKISRLLNPNGLLFLSTLSVNDPEHYNKGTPISGEKNSFIIGTYAHFCTRDELESDFSFLNIIELFEHEYYEPRVTGETHHHISWVIIGRNAIQ